MKIKIYNVKCITRNSSLQCSGKQDKSVFVLIPRGEAWKLGTRRGFLMSCPR